jgi:uroporphyrin-III C-methyltransferase
MDLPHLISIVGAGPGDPELLTVKAMNRLQRAQVVLYDALIGEECA